MKFPFCIFLLLISTLAFASEEYQVSDLQPAKARALFPIGKAKFKLEDLNNLIKELAKKDLYDSLQIIETTPGRIALLAHEEFKSPQIEISGNQALTKQELLQILMDGSSKVNLSSLEKNKNRVVEKYKSIGLNEVSMTVREDSKDNNSLYNVIINEGVTSTLEDIIVLSKNKYLNNYIKFRLYHFIGKTLNSELLKNIDEVIKETLIDNRILDSKVEQISPIYSQDRKNVRLSISIDSTTSYEFVFYDNHYLSSSNILSYLDIDKDYLNYVKNQKIMTKKIENLYKLYGFPDTTVVSEDYFVEKMNKHIITFKIQEGQQYKIKNVSVGGKISRAPSYYENLFSESLGELKSSTYYIEENINKALASMIVKLKDEGYLRAEKILIDQQIHKNGTVDIHIQINEGILTQIRSIQFVGLKSFTSNQLFEVIHLKPNDPLNLNLVAKSFDEIKKFYLQNGYLDFKITTTQEKLIQYLDNYEFADLKFELHEGPKIIVKDILVRGNNKTKTKVILREIDIHPGDTLTSKMVNDSAVFLERTQLFSRAQINTSDEKTDIIERTVFVDVQERNPGLFTGGIGLTNERGPTYRGYLGLSYKNLGGTGRGISSRADIKYSTDKRIEYPENKLVIGYYEPYLFANRLRGRISFTHDQEVFEITTDNKVRIQETNEFNFFLEKQFTRQLKFIWSVWNFSHQRIFNKDNPGDQPKKVNIGSLGPSFELDRRDDLFNPKAGTFTIGQIEYADPLLLSSDDSSNFVKYWRATASHTLYTPLTNDKRWVYVNSLRGGYVNNLSSLPQSGVPATKSFFLGGRSTLRGFDLRLNERVPSLLEVCGSNCLLENFKVKKDSLFFVIKSEVRFPVMGKVNGVLFYDGGAVYLTGVPISDHYRDTAGFGFRVDTPIGAIAAELGFKLDRKGASPQYLAEAPYAFYLSMGNF